MLAGIQVLNDDNIVQIDSNYLNNALVRAGPFSGGWTLQNVTVRGVNPMIFFRSSSRTALSDRRQSGQDFTFYFYALADGTYYIFDETDAQTGLGFQVFNGDGRLAFDAGHCYLRILNMEWLKANYSASSNFVLMPGKVTAIMGNGFACDFFSDEIDPTGSQYRISRAWNYVVTAPNGYNVVQEVETYVSGVPIDGGWPSQCLVADVTGYATVL